MSALRTRRHLSSLLAAAASPARPGELDGEDMVVAAFRVARPTRAPRSRRRTVLRTILTRLASAKLVAACAAAAAAGAGGVAAATVGGLPNLFRAGPAASASALPVRTKVPAGGVDRPLVQPPSPSVLMDHRSRCREWARRDRDARQHGLDEPEFRDLINRAGRRDREVVDRFCHDLLNGAPSAEPSARPSIWPTDRPGGPGSRPRDPRNR